MNSKDMINNVNGMQDNINSNNARYNELNTDVNERKTTIDTIQGKVNELNQKEYNVKVNIVNAMNSKGLNATTNDSYDTLANKLKTIDNTATMYSYAMQVTYSYNVPNNASYGDIWIPLEGSNYKLVFTDSTNSITSPSANEIYLTYNDAILEINFDTSINNYTTSTTHKLNLQISSNTFVDNIGDDYIPVILSELNRYLVKPTATYKYGSTFTEFEAFWYNGRGWRPINYKRNPNLLLYGETNTQNIFAHNKDTGACIWVSRKALNKNMNEYCNCAVGRDLIAIMRNSASSTEVNYLGFFDKNGTLIRIDEYNSHNNMDNRVQAICYCGYNNSFYSLRNTSSSTVKLFRYDGTSGSFIVNYQFNVTENKTIITCMGDKLFLSSSTAGDAEIVEVDANSLSPIKTHTLPSLREHIVHMNYIYIVNCSKSTNDNTVIEKYEYTNGSFNLVKSTTILTHSTYNYTRLAMVSNPTNHIPHLVLSSGYTSGGYTILDTDLNLVSTVTNSAITTTYRNSPYAKISAFGDGRLAYNLEYYNTDNLGYIAIFNLFSGNNDIIVNNKSSDYSSILLGTTTGLLNDLPYEY